MFEILTLGIHSILRKRKIPKLLYYPQNKNYTNVTSTMLQSRELFFLTFSFANFFITCFMFNSVGPGSGEDG